MLGDVAWAYVISQNALARIVCVSLENLSRGQQRCHMLISRLSPLSVQSLPVLTPALALGCLLLLFFNQHQMLMEKTESLGLRIR